MRPERDHRDTIKIPTYSMETVIYTAYIYAFANSYAVRSRNAVKRFTCFFQPIAVLKKADHEIELFDLKRASMYIKPVSNGLGTVV